MAAKRVILRVIVIVLVVALTLWIVVKLTGLILPLSSRSFLPISSRLCGLSAAARHHPGVHGNATRAAISLAYLISSQPLS